MSTHNRHRRRIQAKLAKQQQQRAEQAAVRATSAEMPNVNVPTAAALIDIVARIRAAGIVFTAGRVCHHTLTDDVANVYHNGGSWWVAIPEGPCQVHDGFEFLVVSDASACRLSECDVDHRAPAERIAAYVEEILAKRPSWVKFVRMSPVTTAPVAMPAMTEDATLAATPGIATPPANVAPAVEVAPAINAAPQSPTSAAAPTFRPRDGWAIAAQAATRPYAAAERARPRDGFAFADARWAASWPNLGRMMGGGEGSDAYTVGDARDGRERQLRVSAGEILEMARDAGARARFPAHERDRQRCQAEMQAGRLGAVA